MFVISLKSKTLKRTMLILLCAVFVTIGGVYFVNKTEEKSAAKISGYSMNAETPQERTAFFAQYGWEIKEEPLEIKEVIIPREFDETYASYNEIQKNQGLDLEPYKGARVKMWSYEIANYPTEENCDSVIVGNILVLNGKVIGGDVSSTALSGFMHGFQKTAQAESENNT